MAMELKEGGVVVGPMHPGHFQNGLGAGGKTHQIKEAVEPGEAAENLWTVCMGKGYKTGRFWHREGMELEAALRSLRRRDEVNLYEGCGLSHWNFGSSSCYRCCGPTELRK